MVTIIREFLCDVYLPDNRLFPRRYLKLKEFANIPGIHRARGAFFFLLKTSLGSASPGGSRILESTLPSPCSRDIIPRGNANSRGIGATTMSRNSAILDKTVDVSTTVKKADVTVKKFIRTPAKSDTSLMFGVSPGPLCATRVHVPLAENQHNVKLMFKRNHRSRGALPVPHI